MAGSHLPGLHRVRVQLEAVTPMFVGGAEPTGRPEVRAPSLRGVLRYWFRAALGGVSGANLDFVRRSEAALFGTAADRGSVSALMVRARAPGQTNPWSVPKEAGRTVHRNGKTYTQPTSRSYLWWSMGMTGRSAIPAGAGMEVELQVWPGAYRPRAQEAESRPSDLPVPEDVLTTGLLLLWLASCLGGMGSRSRRGAGSFAVQLASGQAAPPALPVDLRCSADGVPQAAEALGRQLQAALAWLARTWQAPPAARLSSAPEFDVLHRDWCTVWVLGVWPDWQQAVEAMGAGMRDFRLFRPPDYPDVLDWYHGTKSIQTVERSVFGLPLPFYYSSSRTRFSVVPVVGGRDLDRRASPLWLTVWKLGNGKCAGVATLFRSAFLPAQGQLKATGRSSTVRPPAGFQLIEQFVQQKFPQARRVPL